MIRLRNHTAHANARDTPFRGRAVLVMGLGRFGGGVGVTRWLAEQGARVTVTDQARADTLEASIRSLAGREVAFKLGAHDVRDLKGVELVIVNPAVDQSSSAFFGAIVQAGVPWTTEMNLFCERCPAPVIGVTGSFGKSTVCAMLTGVLEAHSSETGGAPTGVHLGGNIGRSLLGELTRMRPTDVVVLEMSNAQLDDLCRIHWAPAVAVITNIYPHHMDRYAAFEDYVTAKLNILARVDRRGHGSSVGRQHVIVGGLDPTAAALFADVVNDRTHAIVPVPDHARTTVELRVPGLHNQMNARVVLATARQLKLDDALARRALARFRGLAHRLEFVATRDGIAYYNDSKSTSPTATVIALDALRDRSIVAIAGGQRKAGVSCDVCARAMIHRCRAVVCMGECGADFAEALAGLTHAIKVRLLDPSEPLERALCCARSLARAGDAVLFSPGAPSFDAYANFVARGDHFTRLVTGDAPARPT